jgi:hypothetical protein
VGLILRTLASGGRHHEHQGQPQVWRPHRPPGGLQPGLKEQGGRRCRPPSGESTFSLSIVASTDPVNLLLFLKLEFHSQGRIVTGYSVGLCDKFFQVKMLLH